MVEKSDTTLNILLYITNFTPKFINFTEIIFGQLNFKYPSLHFLYALACVD